jgi:isochorismate synthase
MSAELHKSAIDKQINLQSDLHALLTYAFDKGHSTAAWKTPADSTMYLAVDTEAPLLLKEINLEELDRGFIFAPFDKSKNANFIRAEILFSFNLSDGTQETHTTESVNYLTEALQLTSPKSDYFVKADLNEIVIKESEEEFIELVNTCLSNIQNGRFEKVVPSRRLQVPIKEGIDVVSLFEKLCALYPNTMVSLVSIPGTGTWLGASPELLVSSQEKKWFHTVALAGTQAYSPSISLQEVSWTQKEIEEQALVSRYIINCFKKIRLREFEEHGPKSIKAANLIHLKTDFKVDMMATNFPQLTSVMLKLLHPTSAVCGMPLEDAHNFLLRHEGYDREYYSGYLGPVNCFDQTHLYVNLRCLQFFRNYVYCYAGAGITIDSNSEKEFLETEMKMKTMLNILN